ncbi:hypothetical protein LCGC14_0589230 [marine sediment metagenome]|uniref:Uncharacterized protein n=1 Tax=marine sediment metagenome TaxID=412755 RepID=A0A0F9U0C5_9ZZZZ
MTRNGFNTSDVFDCYSCGEDFLIYGNESTPPRCPNCNSRRTGDVDYADIEKWKESVQRYYVKSKKAR